MKLNVPIFISFVYFFISGVLRVCMILENVSFINGVRDCFVCNTNFVINNRKHVKQAHKTNP